jgi:ribosomal protein L40E
MVLQMYFNLQILSEEEYHQHMNPNITLPPNPNTAGLICSKCDGSNPEYAIFCNKCGSKISTSCVSCGARNPSDSTFAINVESNFRLIEILDQSLKNNHKTLPL